MVSKHVGTVTGRSTPLRRVLFVWFLRVSVAETTIRPIIASRVAFSVVSLRKREEEAGLSAVRVRCLYNLVASTNALIM